MVYQPQTHARPYEPSQREIEASDAEVQRFLDDPEAEDVDWETYAAGYTAEDDLCKGVRRMSTTPQKAPEPHAPFRHYSYRDDDERPPAWQRKSAF